MTTEEQISAGRDLRPIGRSLGQHVNKGTWVDRYSKSVGSWEWFQWNRWERNQAAGGDIALASPKFGML